MDSVDVQQQLERLEEIIKRYDAFDSNQFYQVIPGSFQYEEWKELLKKWQCIEQTKRTRGMMEGLFAMAIGTAKKERLTEERVQIMRTETKREVQERVMKHNSQYRALEGNQEAQEKFIEDELLNLNFSDTYLNSTRDSFFQDVETATRAAGLNIEEVRERMREFNRYRESSDPEDKMKWGNLMDVLTREIRIPITRQLLLMGYKIGEAQF